MFLIHGACYISPGFTRQLENSADADGLSHGSGSSPPPPASTDGLRGLRNVSTESVGSTESLSSTNHLYLNTQKSGSSVSRSRIIANTESPSVSSATTAPQPIREQIDSKGLSQYVFT